jgi:hypothetical protein
MIGRLNHRKHRFYNISKSKSRNTGNSLKGHLQRPSLPPNHSEYDLWVNHMEYIFYKISKCKSRYLVLNIFLHFNWIRHLKNNRAVDAIVQKQEQISKPS